jgi:hypothetical protein
MRCWLCFSFLLPPPPRRQADSPTPFLAVNICPSTTSGRYVVSATTCGAPISGDGSAQTIALKPVLLVNGVSYVPAIVRSATIGTRVQQPSRRFPSVVHFEFAGILRSQMFRHAG